jgi:acetyl-CoA acetyltransferase
MNEAYVIDVGITEFGRHPERSLTDMGREASWKALKNACIHPEQIQAGFSGNGLAPYLQKEVDIGQGIFKEVGIVQVPISNVSNACASGSCAFREAWLAVASGLYELVIAVGTEKTFMGKGTMLDVGSQDFQLMQGGVFPGDFALRARRHIWEFGTTREQLAKVSVKNHKNGCLNPYSQFKKEFTVEEVLNSPMVADPLTVLSCCPNSDGSAAAVIGSKDFAKSFSKKPIRIAASVLRSGTYDTNRNLALFDMDFELSRIAYDRSGYGPEDIDVAEVHDAFTIAELMHYEGLGFCKLGEGGRLIDNGETDLGGRVPVNPSGGLLSRGHPVGATGIAQIAEIVWQLRGEAGKRQVENARVGMAHVLGGGREGDVGAGTIHILARD